MGTCRKYGHKEVKIARHGAILSGSVIIYGLGIGDIAVELKVNLVADAGCRYIDADVIAYARDYHWCGVDGLSRAESFGVETEEFNYRGIIVGFHVGCEAVDIEFAIDSAGIASGVIAYGIEVHCRRAIVA